MSKNDLTPMKKPYPNRSRAVVLAAAGVAIALSGATASAQQTWDTKRGIAGGSVDTANAINARWMYRWSNNPPPGVLDGSFRGEYVPMIWSANTDNIGGRVQNILDYREDLNVRFVIGFNEPERQNQANMSVSRALDVWDAMDDPLKNAGLSLVSPGVSDNAEGRQWLSEFMSGAADRGLQVDHVAFHWYGNVNVADPAASANAFLNSVDYYHATYDRPVWITEFAGLDFGDDAYASQEIQNFNAAFLRRVIPELEARSYVERYSWWQYGQGDNGEQDDSRLVTDENGLFTPTNIGDEYIPSLKTNEIFHLDGKTVGQDNFYLRGGRLINRAGNPVNTAANLDAIDGDSGFGGGSDWDVTGGTLRVRPGATLTKVFANTVTVHDSDLFNDGTIHVDNGTLVLGDGIDFGGSAGTYSVSRGTLRLAGEVNELRGNIIVNSGGAALLAGEAGAMTAGIEVQAGGTLVIGQRGLDGNVFPDVPSAFVNNGTVSVVDDEVISNMTGGGTLYADEEQVLAGDNGGFDGEIGVRDGTFVAASDVAFGSSAGVTNVFGDQRRGYVGLQDNVSVAGETLRIFGRQGGAFNAPSLLNLGGSNTFDGPIDLVNSGGSEYNLAADAGMLTIAGDITSDSDTGRYNLKLLGAGDGVVTGDIAMRGAAPAALFKAGTGTWTLAGNATGFDLIRVSGGTLSVTGVAEADQFLVAAGATLEGTGRLGGPLDVAGVLSPGIGGAGILAVGDLAFSSGDGQLLAELFGDGSNDLVAATGSVSLGGASLTLALGEGIDAGDSFVILTGPSVTGTFGSLDLLGGDGDLGVAIDYQPGQVVATITAIPEPATFIGGLGGLGALLLRRRARGR